MHTDEHYMNMALELARNGFGHVAPNPMVGAVIVYDGKVIGSGFHEKYGGPHAEVNAVRSVPKDLEHLIPESTIYVTLEPCAHFGKTPPCADLLVEKRFKRVVIGSFDPNPKVSGSGTAKIKNAGIEVSENVMGTECDELNKRFMTFHKRRRPYIFLKWAQSYDGFMAPETPAKLWLSGEESKKKVHFMRATEDAILVGTKTIEIDNPELTPRLVEGKNPIRLVIDEHLSLDPAKKVFLPTTQVFVYNSKSDKTSNHIQYVKLDFSKSIVPQILSHIHNVGIQSLIVEGGPSTLQSFIDENAWDEALVITAPITLVHGKKSPAFSGRLISEETIGSDVHATYKNIRV